MGFLFLFVGKTKEGFIKDGLDKYFGYVKRYVPAEVREVKGVKGASGSPEGVMEKEADLVLGKVDPADTLVLLDEQGSLTDTTGFAKKVGRLAESGRRTVFVAGGPYGNSERLKKRADISVSLSRLTFTHEMARLVLMEQVYRAFTILKGKTYHY